MSQRVGYESNRLKVRKMSNYIRTSGEGKENVQIVEHDIPPYQQFPVIQQPLLFRILPLVHLIFTPCPTRRSGSIAFTRSRQSPRIILAQTHSTCGVHDLAYLRRKNGEKVRVVYSLYIYRNTHQRICKIYAPLILVRTHCRP